MTILSGCVMNWGTQLYNNEKKIPKNHDSYNLVLSKQFVSGNLLSGSADKLEGMGMIWKFNADEDTDVTITYQIKVSSGKAKLVLIAPDDSITTLVECTEESDAKDGTSDTIKVSPGISRIKLIGAKDTKTEYEISADKGKMCSFGD